MIVIADISLNSLQKVDYRKTLEDDGAGRLKTEVQQVDLADSASRATT